MHCTRWKPCTGLCTRVCHFSISRIDLLVAGEEKRDNRVEGLRTKVEGLNTKLEKMDLKVETLKMKNGAREAVL